MSSDGLAITPEPPTLSRKPGVAPSDCYTMSTVDSAFYEVGVHLVARRLSVKVALYQCGAHMGPSCR